MLWYYLQENKQVGPIPEEDFIILVMGGGIGPETLVWNETLSEWIPYGSLKTAQASLSGEPQAQQKMGHTQPDAALNELQDSELPWNTEAKEESAHSGGPRTVMQLQSESKHAPEYDEAPAAQEVLAEEKVPVRPVSEKLLLRESEEAAAPAPSGRLVFAGFWIRTGAMIIDNIILLAVIIPLWGAAALLVENVDTLISIQVRMLFITGIGYHVLFTGCFGATLGKMIFGLKIVRPQGERIGFVRACVRFVAYIASSIILGLGFFMAAFDTQKRALHDHISDTRVIKTRG